MTLLYIGLNIKPTLGRLFEEETLDVIMGIADGGVYHVQIMESCDLTGDMNNDGSWNVLDIVSLANCVLLDNCTDASDGGCAADVNGDGNHNVLDIVTLANCVLQDSCDD